MPVLQNKKYNPENVSNISKLFVYKCTLRLLWGSSMWSTSACLHMEGTASCMYMRRVIFGGNSIAVECLCSGAASGCEASVPFAKSMSTTDGIAYFCVNLLLCYTGESVFFWKGGAGACEGLSGRTAGLIPSKLKRKKAIVALCCHLVAASGDIADPASRADSAVRRKRALDRAAH